VKRLVLARAESADQPFTEDMLFVPGGAFILGTNKPAPYPADGEGPPRIVALSDFLLDRDEVFETYFNFTPQHTFLHTFFFSFFFFSC
jgi:formylglycine-generating enzyme